MSHVDENQRAKVLEAFNAAAPQYPSETVPSSSTRQARPRVEAIVVPIYFDAATVAIGPCAFWAWQVGGAA